MATIQRRSDPDQSSRRRSSVRNRRPAKSKGKILSPSSFRGKGAVPRARRSIARNANKVSPKLNRELI